MLGAILSFAPVAAAAPRIVPLERALQAVSFGPTLSAEASLAQGGAGAVGMLGLALVVYHRDAKTDPACEEHRRKERESLGGEAVKPWGDVIKGMQQPCPAISESWWPRVEARAEVGMGGWKSQGVHLRGSGGGFGWRWFLLGATLAATWADDGAGETAMGLRVGPELSAHFRFGRENRRPVLAVFARGEVSVRRRDFFGDQVSAGARFLFDL